LQIQQVSEEDCKKNPLRFELSQEETHKEKNKTNKQTNKTSLEASVAGYWT